MSYYKHAGILESIGNGKTRITDTFLTKGNREEMVFFFYEFVKEQGDKAKAKKQQAIERVNDSALSNIDEQIESEQEHLDLDMKVLECIEFLEDLGYVIWSPDEADRVL